MFMKEETADLFTLDQQNAAREVEKILNLRKQEFNGKTKNERTRFFRNCIMYACVGVGRD